MNNEIDPVRDHGHPEHPAMQPGCRYWTPIFKPKVDDTARPAPAKPAPDDETAPAGPSVSKPETPTAWTG